MASVSTLLPVDLAHQHSIQMQQEKQRPMGELVQSLINAFDQGKKGEEIAHLMEEYARNYDDWKEYAHFCPLKYSRNLVARTKVFELMVICWGENQKSPIHNHEGQNCWMGVLDGQIEETYFKFKNTGSTKGVGPLEETDSRPLETGTVGYITDDIALHVIRPLTKSAVSLHLYSLPIQECNLYCPSTGTITRRRLGFYTEYNKYVPQDNSPGCCPPTTAKLSS